MKLEKKILLDLHNRILKIRLTEEQIAKRYTEWQMRCPTHLSIGQEAVAAGVSANLNDEDLVLSTHRSHAHYLAKGGSIKRMIAEIYGKSTGCSGGKGGSMHLIDQSVGFMGSTAIVGNTIPLAVGLGLSLKLKNKDNISCVYFGEGATEEGVFYESVNFAVLKSLPVLFICENNLYSVYSPLNVRQPLERKIHEMVNAFGIETDFGDGNNAEEVYRKTQNAIRKIKNQRKPQFIEFETYRWREHCGPNFDNDIGYRSEEEFEMWKKKDPLKHCEDDLLKLTNEEKKKYSIGIQKIIDEAFNFAINSPFPTSSQLQKDVYKE